MYQILSKDLHFLFVYSLIIMSIQLCTAHVLNGSKNKHIAPAPSGQISVIGSKLNNCCQEFIIFLSVYNHPAISPNWLIIVLKFHEGNFFNELFKTQAAYSRCGIIQNHGVFANYVRQDGRKITRSALNWGDASRRFSITNSTQLSAASTIVVVVKER